MKLLALSVLLLLACAAFVKAENEATSTRGGRYRMNKIVVFSNIPLFFIDTAVENVQQEGKYDTT